MQPLSPSTINPFLSQGIDMMLLRALEKKPSDRFARVIDFASAFEQIIQPMAAPATVRISDVNPYRISSVTDTPSDAISKYHYY